MFRLGLLLVIGIGLFIVGVYYLGRKQNVFRNSLKINAAFSDVQGLTNGSNVMYMGIDVGTVAGISIINDSTILVQMSIDKKVQKFIHKNAKAEITNEGVLGNKMVTINQGNQNTGIVQENDTLKSKKSVSIEDLISQTNNIVRDSRSVTAQIAQMVSKINSGKGDLGKLINNSDITNKLDSASNNLLNTAKQIDDITKKVNNGQGDLGLFINKKIISSRFMVIADKVDSTLDKVHEFAGQINQTAEEINYGDGLLNKIIYDSVMAEKLDTAVTKVNKSVDDITAAAEQVEGSWLLRLFGGKKKNHKKD